MLRSNAGYYDVGQNVLVPCLQGTPHLILLLARKVTCQLLIILCITPGVSLYPHLYSVILLGLRSQQLVALLTICILRFSHREAVPVGRLLVAAILIWCQAEPEPFCMAHL